MDLTKTISTGKAVLRVVGNKADGTPGSFASDPTFTVESGPVTVSPGSDANSQNIDVDASVASSSVIRVDANCDLSGGSRIVTARLFLSVAPVGIPSNEVTDIVLSVE